MAGKSTIEWTEATWNPVTGCAPLSEGCRNCYAAELAAGRLKNHPSRVGLATRTKAGNAVFNGEIRWNENWARDPLRWQKPRQIFVCAHSDLFHASVPLEMIDRVFAVMAIGERHTFQVLTKRPDRMASYIRQLPDREREIAEQARKIGCTLCDARDGRRVVARGPLRNVWVGTSIEDQPTADDRLPDLMDCDGYVRFISAEPLLGPVDLTRWLGCDIGQVIVGGESGKRARPMHPDWPRQLRDQCLAAKIPFFFKQWGAWLPEFGADNQSAHHWPDGTWAHLVGKEFAGRLLDGREWNEMPKSGRAESAA